MLHDRQLLDGSCVIGGGRGNISSNLFKSRWELNTWMYTLISNKRVVIRAAKSLFFFLQKNNKKTSKQQWGTWRLWKWLQQLSDKRVKKGTKAKLIDLISGYYSWQLTFSVWMWIFLWPPIKSELVWSPHLYHFKAGYTKSVVNIFWTFEMRPHPIEASLWPIYD